MNKLTYFVLAVICCVLGADAARRAIAQKNAEPRRAAANRRNTSAHSRNAVKTTAEPPTKAARPTSANTGFPSLRVVDSADLVKSAEDFRCPDKWGRYPLIGQCDAYVECADGVPEEKLCPDGLLFNAFVGHYGYPCSYPIDVDCTGRESVQPANSTEDCPHQFGYYRHGDAASCGQFINCADGVPYIQDCPEGLAFNPAIYKCDWPDQVAECDAEQFLGFRCPPAPVLKGLHGEEIESPNYRTFRSNTNCQRYFLCLSSGPRLLGCQGNTAYDEETGSCVNADLVDTCPEELRNAVQHDDNELELDVRSAAPIATPGQIKRGKSTAPKPPAGRRSRKRSEDEDEPAAKPTRAHTTRRH